MGERQIWETEIAAAVRSTIDHELTRDARSGKRATRPKPVPLLWGWMPHLHRLLHVLQTARQRRFHVTAANQSSYASQTGMKTMNLKHAVGGPSWLTETDGDVDITVKRMETISNYDVDKLAERLADSHIGFNFNSDELDVSDYQ